MSSVMKSVCLSVCLSVRPSIADCVSQGVGTPDTLGVHIDAHHILLWTHFPILRMPSSSLSSQFSSPRSLKRIEVCTHCLCL